MGGTVKKFTHQMEDGWRPVKPSPAKAEALSRRYPKSTSIQAKIDAEKQKAEPDLVELARLEAQFSQAKTSEMLDNGWQY